MTDRAESEDEPPEEAATSALQIGPSLIEDCCASFIIGYGCFPSPTLPRRTTRRGSAQLSQVPVMDVHACNGS